MGESSGFADVNNLMGMTKPFISRIAAIAILAATNPAFSQQTSGQQSTQARLAELRSQIDQTDRQIVHLLNERAKIVAEVGAVKKAANLPVAAPSREQQVLDHVVQMGSAGPLPAEPLRRIYQTIIQEMRTWEAGLVKAE